MRINLKTLYINNEGAEPLYLLTQRSPDAPSAPNAWSLIGGLAADGEPSDDAAHRLSAERVGLTGHKLICIHEWVQSGISTSEPALRSLRISETSATVADIRLDLLQSANFYPLRQISRKTMTDTTRTALHLTLPDLIPTLPTAGGVTAVLFDLNRKPTSSELALQPDAVETSTDLHRLGYLTGVAVDPNPAEYRSWPLGMPSGEPHSVDPSVLRPGHPDPDLYRVAAKRLGVHASECVCVSTDRLALVAASAAGAVPVRLDDPEQPERNPQIHAGREPWPVIGNLTDLLDVLPHPTPAS